MSAPFETLAAAVPHEMTLRQLAILSILDRSPPLSLGVRELSRAAGVSKPVVTRALNTFEARHLTARMQHPSDLRMVLIVLTAAGKALLAAARRAVAPPA